MIIFVSNIRIIIIILSTIIVVINCSVIFSLLFYFVITYCLILKVDNIEHKHVKVNCIMY